MAAIDDLKELLSHKHDNLKKWFRGNIPVHYKRLSCDMDTAIRLAKEGQIKMGSYYGDKCIMYFTQSLIAGAYFSGDYDEIAVIGCSRYGKTWLSGRMALVAACEGREQLVTHVTRKGTEMIMKNVVGAIKDIDPEMQRLIEGVNLSKLDRLETSLSKNKISIAGKGSIEPISLVDTLNDKLRNEAIGRGASTINDEAAMQSDEAHSELAGRTDLEGHADKENKKELSLYISNPHRRGWFWDMVNEKNVPERTLVIWMDGLTALEEGVWTEEQILNSKFNKVPGHIKKYWLCELEDMGDSMLPKAIIDDEFEEDEYAQHFLGVDSAYKGKDQICVAHSIVNYDGTVHIKEVAGIPKPPKGEWFDGVTGEDICDHIKLVANAYGVNGILLDQGGPGGGWLNEGLASRHLPVKAIYFNERPTPARVKAGQWAATNAVNKRAEMVLDLMRLMQGGMVTFSSEAYEAVKDTLPLITYKTNSQGKIIIRDKEEIKVRLRGKSPDEFDSVIMAAHIPVLYNQM